MFIIWEKVPFSHRGKIPVDIDRFDANESHLRSGRRRVPRLLPPLGASLTWHLDCLTDVRWGPSQLN